MPVFSVLLPTHNRADVLPHTIRSILNQTFKDFELLIVGDGCTDNTADVVAEFDDARIIWFDLPKSSGFGYANRNFVLKKARGTFIALASHDDLYFPDHLALMQKVFDNEKIDWAYSLGLWVMPNGTVVPATGNLHNRDEFEIFIKNSNFIATTFVVHRRSCFERFGYWPEEIDYGGDWALWKRILGSGDQDNYSYLPMPTALHFRANWRKSGIPSIDCLAELADRSDWWPEVFKVKILNGVEQGTFVEHLCENNGAWMAAARDAVNLVAARVLQEHAALLLKNKEVKSNIENLESAVQNLLEIISDRNLYTSNLLMSFSGFLSQAKSESDLSIRRPNLTFDEDAYLHANADVAAAVARGQHASGFAHWLGWGVKENRPLKLKQ